MKKELENLQDAVNSINITEAMQMEIIQKVKTATKRYGPSTERRIGSAGR